MEPDPVGNIDNEILLVLCLAMNISLKKKPDQVVKFWTHI